MICKYYVLESGNILSEDEYVKLRTREYYEEIESNNDSSNITLENYLENDIDWGLYEIIEIDEEAFRRCETFEDLVNTSFGTSTIFEDYDNTYIWKSEYNLGVESFDLTIMGNVSLSIEFEVTQRYDEDGNDLKEYSKVKYIGFNFK